MAKIKYRIFGVSHQTGALYQPRSGYQHKDGGGYFLLFEDRDTIDECLHDLDTLTDGPNEILIFPIYTRDKNRGQET